MDSDLPITAQLGLALQENFRLRRSCVLLCRRSSNYGAARSCFEEVFRLRRGNSVLPLNNDTFLIGRKNEGRKLTRVK